MSVRIAAAALSILMLVSAAAEADSPCIADATMCVAGSNAAECYSFGAIIGGRMAESSVIASAGDPLPDAQNTHVVGVGPIEGAPGPRIHLGAVESHCQAELTGASFVNHKACGRAGAGEVIIDAHPIFVITARGLMAEGCSSAGSPSGPLNSAWVGSLVIWTPAQTTTLTGPLPSNQAIPLGIGTLYLNEDYVRPSSCLANEGSALRLVLGSTTTLAIGWVSTGAC